MREKHRDKAAYNVRIIQKNVFSHKSDLIVRHANAFEETVDLANSLVHVTLVGSRRVPRISERCKILKNKVPIIKVWSSGSLDREQNTDFLLP